MEIGTGIFLSCIFLGLIIIFISTKDRWKWKKIVLYFFIFFSLLFIFGGGGLYLYLQYEEKPKIHNELVGIKLGMSKEDVLFSKGKPKEIDNNSTNTKYEFWKYVFKNDFETFIRVGFYEDKVMRIIWYNNSQYKNVSLGKISEGDSSEKIYKVYGEPDSMSRSIDNLSRTYNYNNYHVSFSLHLNEVEAVSIYDPKISDGLFFENKNSTNEKNL